MKKRLLVTLGVAGAVVGMTLLARKCTGGASMWERMAARMAEMPEDFPPRVMFDNVAATREQTTRILEILEEREAAKQPAA